MDVTKVAKLANLPLNPAQLQTLQSSLDQVLTLVNHVQELDTTDVLPTSQVTGLTNITREDDVDLSRVLTQQEALSNSTNIHNGYFEVNAIFHGE